MSFSASVQNSVRIVALWVLLMHVASDWVVVVIRVSSGISVCSALLVPATYTHGSTSGDSEGSYP